MNRSAVQRLLALTAIFIFVADLTPPPSQGPGKRSGSGCSKASQALYHVSPRVVSSATRQG